MNYARAPPAVFSRSSFFISFLLSIMTNHTPSPAVTENKPVASFQYGRVSAAIFRDGGEDDVAMNVSIRKSYKDKAGVWKSTHTLAPADLLPAALALTKCFEWIATSAKDAE